MKHTVVVRQSVVLRCNDRYYLNEPMSIHWRASLVPAAAVIPAPTAGTFIVVVKKLVVRLGAGNARVRSGSGRERRAVSRLLALLFNTPCDRNVPGSISTHGCRWVLPLSSSLPFLVFTDVDWGWWEKGNTHPVRGCYREQNNVSKAGCNAPPLRVCASVRESQGSRAVRACVENGVFSASTIKHGMARERP